MQLLKMSRLLSGGLVVCLLVLSGGSPAQDDAAEYGEGSAPGVEATVASDMAEEALRDEHTVSAEGDPDSSLEYGEQLAPMEALPPPTVTIREYVVRGNTVLGAADIQRAIYPYLGAGRTLKDIEDARDALQQVYQQNGYQSVYVDLPEQQVISGIVYLQVGETRIGRVRVSEARYTSPLEIRNAVPALAEGSVPDFDLVQQQLTALSSTGKRQVVPVVRAGALPGTMDVDLNVADQSPWHGSIALNNDYSADTTRLRSVATLGHDNLWQRGHAMSLTMFTAPRETDDAMVWSFNYTAPLTDRLSLRFSGYDSDSNVATVGGTTVIGKGSTYGVSAIYTWPFANNWVHSISAGIDFKDFDEEIGLGSDRDKVPLKYAPISVSYTGYRFTDVSQADFSATLVNGFRSLFGYGSSDREFNDKRHYASPSFTALKLASGYTRTFQNDWQASVNGSLQFATGPLVANEQTSAGGASSVRGYLSAEATGDQGGVASIELRTPSLSRLLGSHVNEWRFYGFADGARLETLEPLEETRSVFRLASAGIGTRAQMMEWLSWNLDLAWPLRNAANTEEHDARVHFNVRASF